MNLRGLRIAIVGPLPPPEGGMANQTLQLRELLRGEGAHVAVVQVNNPYRPRWIAGIRGIRAVFRLVPYLIQLWRAAGQVRLFHVMANSGWSWHLFAAPAIWIARMRGVRSVVNYRGGEAEAFLARSSSIVLATLRRANVLAVPSGFLQRVFSKCGVSSEVVPNIVDLERFRPDSGQRDSGVAHVVVARSLEPIYDIGTALRAFKLVRQDIPSATMSLAGSGPERNGLLSLAKELGIAEAVKFCGSLNRDQMAELYRSASVVINPSRVDNMPNSVLEAMASGAPVVSTNVGGVPFIVQDDVNGLLVPAGDHTAMASAVKRLLRDSHCADRLRDAALSDVQAYAWPGVKQRWIEVYAMALTGA
jgi:glycosyltransferase involved in cell wall biosynthesis